MRMFGIPIQGPTNVYCDNASVVINTLIPASTLRRKHNTIAYHRVREAAAAGTIRVTKESHETNIADMLIKPVNGICLRELCHRVLFWCTNWSHPFFIWVILRGLIKCCLYSPFSLFVTHLCTCLHPDLPRWCLCTCATLTFKILFCWLSLVSLTLCYRVYLFCQFFFLATLRSS